MEGFVAEEKRINLLKQEWLPLMVLELPKWAIELAQESVAKVKDATKSKEAS